MMKFLLPLLLVALLCAAAMAQIGASLGVRVGRSAPQLNANAGVPVGKREAQLDMNAGVRVGRAAPQLNANAGLLVGKREAPQVNVGANVRRPEMSASLNCLAKHFVADLLNGVDAYFASNQWHLMMDLYHLGHPVHRPRMPPAEYTMTVEFALCLKKVASTNDDRYLFTDAPDAWFWFIVPRGLLSRILEAFVHHQTRVTLRRVTIVCDDATPGISLPWPDDYVEQLPCHCCHQDQALDGEKLGMERKNQFFDDRFYRQELTYDDEENRGHPLTHSVHIFHVRNAPTGQDQRRGFGRGKHT
ncbi:hypothetical protein AAVH_24740, partial [Aphelenchoides avenae]